MDIQNSNSGQIPAQPPFNTVPTTPSSKKKWLIIGILVAVALGGLYYFFGDGAMFQGRIALNNNKISRGDSSSRITTNQNGATEVSKEPASIYTKGLDGPLFDSSGFKLNRDPFSGTGPDNGETVEWRYFSKPNMLAATTKFVVNLPTYSDPLAKNMYTYELGLKVCGQKICKNLKVVEKVANNGNVEGKISLHPEEDVVAAVSSLLNSGENKDNLVFYGYAIDPTGEELKTNSYSLVMSDEFKDDLIANASLNGNWLNEEEFTINFKGDEENIYYNPSKTDKYWINGTIPTFKNGVLIDEYKVIMTIEHCDESLTVCQEIGSSNGNAAVISQYTSAPINFGHGIMADKIKYGPALYTDKPYLRFKIQDPSGKGNIYSNALKIVQ